MDINKLALVRVTNIIPFDGRLKPISESMYLAKDSNDNYGFAMGDILKKERKYDLFNDEEYAEYLCDMDAMLPYCSGYNSMVLFSINGVVPDDINNVFSDKTCAIIEDMSAQMSSEVISIMPTDTAIKGIVELSEKAVVLIREDRFHSLSTEEQKNLSSLRCMVRTFEGDVKTAVEEVLKARGYQVETLSLRNVHNGFELSETSELTRATIDKVAEKYDIPQALHFHIITHQAHNMERFESVKHEHDNYIIVQKFYLQTFFEYLFSKMKFDESIEYNITNYSSSQIYLREFGEEIMKLGVDNYRQVVLEYNAILLRMKSEGVLPTPQEIVDAHKRHEKIDLLRREKTV